MIGFDFQNALLAHDIMEIMDTMYPYKSNRDIEKIVYAAAKQLGIDPSTEAFDVSKLLAHVSVYVEQLFKFNEIIRTE